MGKQSFLQLANYKPSSDETQAIFGASSNVHPECTRVIVDYVFHYTKNVQIARSNRVGTAAYKYAVEENSASSFKRRPVSTSSKKLRLYIR